MPMYDFECNGCKHTFEAIARLDELPPCPECQSTDVTRLMSAPSISGKAEIHYQSETYGKQWGGRPKRQWKP